MSATMTCDRCKCSVPCEDPYDGISHFDLHVLKHKVWLHTRGHLCDTCADEFLKWVGTKE